MSESLKVNSKSSVLTHKRKHNLLVDEVSKKQDELTFDDVPTENSDNPVKSGGVFSGLEDKQDKLVSGTNIKTINNESIVGSGNISISSGTQLYKHELLIMGEDAQQNINAFFIIILSTRNNEYSLNQNINFGEQGEIITYAYDSNLDSAINFDYFHIYNNTIEYSGYFTSENDRVVNTLTTIIRFSDGVTAL